MNVRTIKLTVPKLIVLIGFSLTWRGGVRRREAKDGLRQTDVHR